MTEITRVPLWQVLQPTDHQADFGKNSTETMMLSDWIKQHASGITIADCAPVNWVMVHSVLATVDVPITDPIYRLYTQVRDRIGTFVGISVTAAV